MESCSEEAAQSSYISTEHLRKKIRIYSREQREKSRAHGYDSLRFGLGEIQAEVKELDSLTVKDVTGLAARIKRQKKATLEDMYRLCHAFLQSVENIRTFATIPGAIQVLVKEFTGNNSERQIAAIETICNLSLGESPVCEKIASLAGSYLVTYLGVTEERLKRTSLWTLANLLSTGGKAARTVIQMELVIKLWHLYTAEDVDVTDDYREDAGVCLQIASKHASKLFRTHDLEYIKENLTAKNPTSVAAQYHLQIIFNCDIINPNNLLNEGSLMYLINYSLNNLTQSTGDIQQLAYRLRSIYAVRVLSNLIATQPNALNFLMSQVATVWQTNLINILNQLFDCKNQALTNECLWLVKTLMSHDISHLGSFLDKFRIPQTFTLIS